MAGKERKDTCFVLSIDGGGIRGVIPACLLMELEKRLAKRNKKKPLHRYFDLIAGSSTGGIIAAGLAAPRPGAPAEPAATPKDLLSLYQDRGRTIFTRDVFRRLREAIADPASLWQEKYDATVLEAELQRQLGTATIHQALTNLVLTAYDIENRRAVFMTNCRAATGKVPDDYWFWQAARATSAAPTYFEPARVTNRTQNRIETLIDGGVFSNDPAMAAFVEALKMGYEARNITVVSLGTGYQNRPFEFREVRNWGPLSWISPTKGAPIISIFMQGQASTASYQAAALLNGGSSDYKAWRYFRFDHQLEIGNDDLDDASDSNIFNLKEVARRIVAAQGSHLDRVADLLEERAA